MFSNSASIATLIRLKFLVDLEDTSDILCMFYLNFSRHIQVS